MLGINGLIANTGEPYKLTSSEQWTGEDVRTLSGVNEFTQEGPSRYQSNKIIDMEGIIIVDRDITFDAMTIRSSGDTVIYVKESIRYRLTAAQQLLTDSFMRQKEQLNLIASPVIAEA